MDFAANSSNLVVVFFTILLAPVAGGFLAGLIAGLTASLFISAAWLMITGLIFQTILKGLAIVFVWVMLSRLMSGDLIKQVEF